MLITHIVTGGDYEGMTAADVAVTIIEDDTAGVTISTDRTGSPGRRCHRSYTVVLDTEPTADVTVALQVPDTADMSRSIKQP